MDRPPCSGTAVAVGERRSMLAERCRGIGAALAPHTFALRVPAARFVNLATSVTGLVGTVEKCSARSLKNVQVVVGLVGSVGKNKGETPKRERNNSKHAKIEAQHLVVYDEMRRRISSYN